MNVSVSGTIDQKTYLKKFRGAQPPYSPLDPPMILPLNLLIRRSKFVSMNLFMVWQDRALSV